MAHRLRPWLPCAALAAAVAVLAALRLSRTPPAEAPPEGDAPPPATLDPYHIRYWLRRQAPDFAVVDAPGRPGSFILSDPSVNPKALMTGDDAHAGWVLCEPAERPGPPQDLGPSEFVVGPYRVRVAITNPESVVGGRRVSAYAAPPGSEGTVFLPSGEDGAGVLVVEARLAVLPMQEIGADGKVKRQFTGYRLTDAVRVGP